MRISGSESECFLKEANTDDLKLKKDLHASSAFEGFKS